MNSAEKQAVLHCLRSMIDEEVCEECPLYGTTGTDHCEKDCVRLAINELEQDEYIKVPKKALKYRTAGMVAYNVEWLKSHFDIERAVICGAQEHHEDSIVEWKNDFKGFINELSMLRDDYNGIMDYIDKVPNEARWIPVSERLPENHKDVLICLLSDQICIGCYNSHRLPFSNNVIGWGASYVHNWCNNDVIAWMPLPEPYKGG